MERQVQYAINELFGRDELLAKAFNAQDKELIKLKRKLKMYKVTNFITILYFLHTVLRHEAMLNKLSNTEPIDANE